MARKPEELFEEGKPMEDYVDPKLVEELNDLEIEPEPNPEAEQRLESVVEAPVRNEKKKPEPPKIIPKAVEEKPVVVPKEVKPLIELPKIILKAEQPQIDLPPPPEAEVMDSARPSFDGMIQRGLSQKKQMLFDKAKKDYEATENQFYDNMFALINMAANGSVVNSVQQQPQISQPQVPQEPLIRIEKDNSEAVKLLEEEIHRIDMDILDPKKLDIKTLHAEKLLLRKQIAKLNGTYVEQPEVVEAAPVSGKVVKPQKEVKGGNVTPKVALALVGLFLICGIGIILLINILWH